MEQPSESSQVAGKGVIQVASRQRIFENGPVSDIDGFVCPICNRWHEGLPLDYAYDAPSYWSGELKSDHRSFLNADFCVIKNEYFFVRSVIEIPILGSAEPFRWGVWSSLSKQNFDRVVGLWTDPKLLDEPPYFSWLSNSIYAYPETLNLKTMMRSRTVNDRPVLQLDESDHPLALDQRNGITSQRIREIAAKALHQRRE